MRAEQKPPRSAHASAGGPVRLDQIVPAGAPWSGVLTAGERLVLTDLEGRQAIDFLCFNAEDPAERYHAPNTIKIPGQVYLGLGSVLYSTAARPMMTVVADDCGGHDTLFGCCGAAVDQVRYGVRKTKGCYENFVAELARHGLGPEHIHANVNWFMSVPIGPDGGATIVEGRSRPGDKVVLRAEMDVLAVLSNCPQTDNPASGGRPTPVRVQVVGEQVIGAGG